MSATTTARIVRNSLSLLLAQVLGKVCSYVFLLYLTRSFGAEIYGVFLTISTLVLSLGLLADCGLSVLTIRDVARDRSSISKYLGAVCVLKLSLAAVGFAALGIVMPVMDFTPDMQLLAWVAGLSLFSGAVAGVLGTGLTAFELIHIASLWGVVINLVGTGSSALALALGYGLLGVFVSSTACSFVLLVGLWWLARWQGITMTFEVDWALLRKLMQRVIPFAMVAWLGLFYFKVDILLLARFRGSQEVAWYGAALKPLEILFFVPSSLMGALFPLMSFYHQHSLGQFWQSYETALRTMLRLALPFAMVCTVLAERIVVVLYGPEFLPAAPALALAAWALLFAFINAPIGNVILTSGLLVRCLPFLALQVCLKFPLTLVLVAHWGYLGACVGALIGEILGFFLHLHYLSILGGRRPPFLKLSLRPAIATAGVGIVVLLFYRWHLGLLLGMSAMSYLVLLIVLGDLKGQDFKTFLGG